MEKKGEVVIFFVLVPFTSILLYKLFKEDRRRDREWDACLLHHDMYDLFMEMFDDPAMSYLKWREWLPIFEAADQRCEELAPASVLRRGRVSDLVRRMIQDDGYQRDLQRR